MAKKKFLNLDNMNILWDNIDRNFLRKEDIPYVEFESLLTENNTIIGAINELFKILQNGGGPSLIPASIECDTTTLSATYTGLNKSINVTYKNCTAINDPSITYGSENVGWLKIIKPTEYTGDSDAKTYSYKFEISPNDGENRSATVKFVCKGWGGEATHSIIVTQSSSKSASIIVESSTIIFEASGGNKSYTVTYNDAADIYNAKLLSGSNWITITESNRDSNTVTYSIVADENINTLNSREQARIELSCVGFDNNKVIKTITVDQPPYEDAIINVSSIPNTIPYNKLEESYIVNYKFSKYIESPRVNVSWVNIIRSEESSESVLYNFVVNENTSSSRREAIITFKCTGKNGKSIEQPVTLIQEVSNTAYVSFNPDPVEVEWDATSISLKATYFDYSNILSPREELPWVGSIRQSFNSGDEYHYEVTGITKNASNQNRTGYLTFVFDDLLNRRVTTDLEIIQKAAPPASISVSPNSPIEVGVEGGTIDLNVFVSNSNSYTVEKITDSDWITFTKEGDHINPENNIFTIKVSKNDGEARTAKLKFQCLGFDNVTTYTTVIVDQSANESPEIDTLPMYIGYIPYDGESSGSEWRSGYSIITEKMISDGVANGNIVKMDAQPITADHTGFGNVPEYSYLLIALPQDSGLQANKWNEVERDCPFSYNPISNGDVSLTIDGINYELYGEYAPHALIANEKEIYYKIK